MKSIYRISLIIVIVATGLMGCKKDYTNPNDATAEQTLSSPVGLTGVAVGLQKAYSNGRAGSLYNLVCANGFCISSMCGFILGCSKTSVESILPIE